MLHTNKGDNGASGCRERKQISASEGQKQPPRGPEHLGTPRHLPGAECCPCASRNRQPGRQVTASLPLAGKGPRRGPRHGRSALGATLSSCDAEAVVGHEQTRSLWGPHARGMGETLGKRRRGKPRAFRRFPRQNTVYERLSQTLRTLLRCPGNVTLRRAESYVDSLPTTETGSVARNGKAFPTADPATGQSVALPPPGRFGPDGLVSPPLSFSIRGDRVATLACGAVFTGACPSPYVPLFARFFRARGRAAQRASLGPRRHLSCDGIFLLPGLLNVSIIFNTSRENCIGSDKNVGVGAETLSCGAPRLRARDVGRPAGADQGDRGSC